MVLNQRFLGMEEDIEMYQEDLVNVESEYEDSKRRWEEIEIEAQRENRFSHQLFDVVLGQFSNSLFNAVFHGHCAVI